ncbi:hypothetical protein CI102_10446 [Trichoderma harzianum]|uniref:Uncharacterized protein n=1 Tax=Trichoderma harzianum CBS 226.95 TaxID=983964 RepID=A0A2T4AGQ0_TRIHA|nr:hypothetical protein M431DRAFT_492723 [Trichoderma harzianum CBS 226.95]PKK45670.1 hypothetical protein CI102_10446 [Trichoderma harzianum]PTB56265.1 hypothetical protein M431DRAFT_492723 [Trichoderma harzianum CBS 226.95]
MEEDRVEVFLRLLFNILGCIAMPGFWIETFIFRILGLNTSSSFRMFPPADIVPGHEYPTSVAYSFVLITILFIPRFIASDRYFDGANTLGTELRPLTRRASPLVEYVVMFARVWLAAAWVNMASAQFMMDWDLVRFSVKLGSVYFIL